MKKTAVILECKFDYSVVQNTRLKVRTEIRENNFGKVKSLVLSDYKHDEIIIYEEGGMNGIRNYPATHLPVYADMYLRGLKNIIILGFCGSLDATIKIGDFVVPNDFIDMSKNRERSFIDKIKPGELFFYRMANPYSPSLQKLLIDTADKIGSCSYLIDNYVVTEGPRFETSSEIKFYVYGGGKAVCMSGVPDASFARELDLNLSIGLYVSNMGEGFKGSKFENILDLESSQSSKLTRIICSMLNSKIDECIDKNYHQPFWMQTPNKEVYNLIK